MLGSKRKSKELFINISDKHHPELPVLSATQDNGMVYRQDLDIDIKYDEESLDNYKKVSPSDFVISLRSFQGGFEMSDKLGITSPAYTIFNFKSPNNQYPVFWKFLFKRYDFIESLKRVTFGIRDGKAISFKQFGDTKPSFPQLKEQQLIANILSKLDKTITLHEEKQCQLEQLKKALLQKMFADETGYPVLRFKGFTEKWEQRKLGEIANIVRGASPRPIKNPKWFDESSDIGWLRISDVTEQDGRVYHLNQHISKLGETKTRVLTEPHVLLSIAATVGKPLINYCKTGVHDGFLIFQKPHFNLEFMFQWLTSFEDKWKKYSQPGSQVNLNSDIVKNQNIAIPSIEEQEKIGQLFQSLDRTITLHDKKIQYLKQLKRGLLQKMFV